VVAYGTASHLPSPIPSTYRFPSASNAAPAVPAGMGRPACVG
jgi:hypothetical protein